jgi:predicted ATP-grasp superfamily ATP-dependent carboligase
MAILILALSGRALAQAAKRTGAEIMLADFFGDIDARALAPWYPLPGSLEAGIAGSELLAWLRGLRQPIDGIVYGAGFEGDPTLLIELSRIAPLIGNSSQVVAAIKDPIAFAELLRDLRLPHPEVCAVPRPDIHWLRKRRGGSGGSHIERVATSTIAVDAAHYIQAVAAGRPVSALFVANGREAQVIGLSVQWAAATPVQPFRYGGCAGPVRLAPKLEDEIARACHAIVATTGLVGLNSLDMLIEGDGFTILEVNPRPGATLDLFDALGSASLWQCHIDGVHGELPAQGFFETEGARAAMVLYADQPRYVPPALEWDKGFADIPERDSRIAAGRPICTVIASAANPGAARALAERRAAALLDRLPLVLQESA